MKKYFCFTIIMFMLLGMNVKANDIKKITMDIYVDNNGNANIVEEWTAELESGSEGYKPYYNLGQSRITNYSVSMNGIGFTTIDNWNVNGSFESKKYQAGIHEINNGYELCFGISEYGNNTYSMKYTITNFVSQTEDADMIYWQLIPYELSDKPDYVYIKIHSDFKYADDLDVWGYGNYGGLAYVYDGVIELVHEDALNSDEYMTVLVKFPKGTFNTSSILDNNFDTYLEMAEKGAKHYNDKKSLKDVIFFIISAISGFLPFIFVALFAFFGAKQSNYGTKKIKFAKDAKKIKDAPYFRDIPCNKDLFLAYWVACHYNLIKNKTDFLGAILLKWLKNGNIENTTVISKFLKKEERAVKLLNTDGMSQREIELYNMMSSASKDGILEKKEFTNWCRTFYKRILNWFNYSIDDVTLKLASEGKISSEQKTFKTVYTVDDRMKETAMQMAGLKKFLNEFSNIKDRESIEVQLWEEYLMFAQIFGIAKKVAKEFKDLYPDVITDEYYDDIIFIHTISYDGVNAASSAKARAESYSAGGGGFSSGGGGGGSFGGGGGGGGFR